MAARRDRRPADPLSNLPEELRAANSPQFCTCHLCRPDLSAQDRADADAGMAAWSRARTKWCAENAVTRFELIRLERPQPSPTKRRSVLKG